jgi:hypothetical protein
MCKSAPLIVIGVMALLGEASLLSAQEKSSPPAQKQEEQAVKYKATDGISKDTVSQSLGLCLGLSSRLLQGRQFGGCCVRGRSERYTRPELGLHTYQKGRQMGDRVAAL